MDLEFRLFSKYLYGDVEYLKARKQVRVSQRNHERKGACPSYHLQKPQTKWTKRGGINKTFHPNRRTSLWVFQVNAPTIRILPTSSNTTYGQQNWGSADTKEITAHPLQENHSARNLKLVQAICSQNQQLTTLQSSNANQLGTKVNGMMQQYASSSN